MDSPKFNRPVRRLSRKVADFGKTGSGAPPWGETPEKASWCEGKKAVRPDEQPTPSDSRPSVYHVSSSGFGLHTVFSTSTRRRGSTH